MTSIVDPRPSYGAIRPRLPHSDECEAAVIGAVILRADTLEQINLAETDFFDPRHRTVWRAIRNLAARGVPVDVATLEAEIGRDGRLDAIGGVAFLGELALRVPTAENAISYAGVVGNLARNRDAIVMLHEAARTARDWPHEASEMVGEVAARLARIATVDVEKDRRPRIVPMRELGAAILEQSATPVMDWGVDGLNRLAALPVRSMATLTGPTGGGKTSLALTLATHRARYDERPGDRQGPTLYVQLELTPAQLAARRCAQILPYSWAQILGGALRDDEMRDALSPEHVYVLKLNSRSDAMAEIRRAMDDLEKIEPGTTPLLVVDYLQRIRGQGRDARESATRVVEDLVDYTESRDMHTLLLSKTSRDGSRRSRDGSTGGEALVDATSETNAIESGSAVMLAITFDNREGEDTTDAKIVIAKGRFGATGAAVGMRFHGPSGRWVELDGPPMTSGQREIREAVVEAVNNAVDGFESRNAIHKSIGGNKSAVLRAVEDELKQGGRLFVSRGRILSTAASAPYVNGVK